MNRKENKKILIVDDTTNNRLLTKAILKSFGYTNFSEACDGQEAIKSVEENEYSLIFMDIKMAKMDGIVATKHIRNTLHKTMPIVAVTAYNSIEVEENVFNDYILKPFRVSEIKSALDRFVN